ncbi:Alpha/Beta hydrolase protein [Ampelomyces quisqualis]|uniref:Alpha/Beta hydrolase protein n=1 Tax=Ampelomyces quisqualis TaxID=50730 RepID=A0A6A5QKG1_AMPQU|nr:Alpha/Beta hydrolase protein [Ampelomyces quisqualis]
MEAYTAHDIKHKNGETTHYFEGGTKDGIPLIFIHGWPDIAETWKHQLAHFSAQKAYRTIALDMRGYGGSSAPKDKRAYSLEVLVGELVDFVGQLGFKKAVWIGHDWGCGVVNALAAHHPELFIALAVLAVPYHTIEYGLEYVKQFINRNIYPKNEYEYGQFEYMRFYELEPEKSVQAFDGHIEKITKVIYARHDPGSHGKPSPTSEVLKDGGWFKGHPEQLPDIPLEYTSLDESLLKNLINSHQAHGFFPPTAYYLNHDVNAEYATSAKNDGVLGFPVLFIDAKHDSVCSPSTTPKFEEIQAEFTKDLTYETVESGHWVQLEKPKEVNEAIEKWLNAKVTK